MAFYAQARPLWDKSELTLAQVAERCNISESSASRYLNGKVNPPADIAEKIIEVLGGPVAAPERGAPDMQTITHIREIYEARIDDMQEEHNSRVEDLRRDKRLLEIIIIVLAIFILYLFLDGLNGSWGIFQHR